MSQLRAEYMGKAMVEASAIYGSDGKVVTYQGSFLMRASSASLAVAICYALRAAHINACMSTYDELA